MISEHISDNIPPQMKILNMVIPILMHYQHFPFKKTVKMYFVALIRPAAASCIYSLVNQWKVALHNDVGFPTVYHRIYCRNFMTLSNQTSRCICKCIRIIFNSSQGVTIKQHFHLYIMIYLLNVGAQ